MEMSRCKYVMSVAFAFVLLAPMSSLGANLGIGAENEPEGTWTIALYVDADCNLEMYWDDPSLPYLLNIPESGGLNIVAMVDRLSTTGVQKIEISGGKWDVVQTYPEMNYGDGETFEWFLTEVSTSYPSDHLVVIPWDHGSAWKGFCWDDSSDGDHITLEEMGEAIVGAGVYIDILAFDACSCSSIEMTYQAAKTGLVELLVASEELVAGDGFPYDLMFTPVANDPSRTPDQVAVDMVDGWIAVYEPLPWAWYCTLGVVDVMEIGESLDVMTDWVSEMYEGLDDYTYNYRMALRDSYYVSCGSHYQVDLVDLGKHLMADEQLMKEKELMAATEAMVEVVESAVKYVYNTDTTAAAGGLSVYWGSHNTVWRYGMDAYCAVAFAAETGWGEFLVLYNLLTCGWMRHSK
jgi:hypothetical protein